jgi:hypothetical protein
MTELKIDKGTPVPSQVLARNGLTALLRGMDVGDSFLYPKVKRTNLHPLFQRIAGSKFATRSADETNVRVWRIE